MRFCMIDGCSTDRDSPRARVALYFFNLARFELHPTQFLED